MNMSNELAELLSAYMDDRLGEEELRRVNELLEEDSVQNYLAALRANRLALKQLSDWQLTSSQSNDELARRIHASIHALTPAEAFKRPSSTGASRKGLISAIVGLAAAILLTIWLPQLARHDSEVQPLIHGDLPPSTESLDALSSKQSSKSSLPEEIEDAKQATIPVTRDDLKIRFLLTVDLQIAATSNVNGAFMPLLDQHGVSLIHGSVMNAQIEKALDEIRSTVAVDALAPAKAICLVRAPANALDKILEKMVENPQLYPVVRLGMAFELPNDPLLERLTSTADVGQATVALSQALAGNLDSLVTADQAFAAPLYSSAQQTDQPASLESIPRQGSVLVSAKSRSAESSSILDATNEGQLSFVLFVLRQ